MQRTACGTGIRIQPIDAAGPPAEGLLALSDQYFAALYPPESNHLDSTADLGRPSVTFVGAYVDTVLAGCGAAKVMEDDGRYGEIRRVFVTESHRGIGVAKAVMQYLEERLREEGVEVARLETGAKQPAALALYSGLGYIERGPFGSYRQDPLSVFMEKRPIARS